MRASTLFYLCLMAVACATVAGSGGCQSKPAPPVVVDPTLPPPTTGYLVTNGVMLVFEAAPSAELWLRLQNVGAETHFTNGVNGMTFILRSVDNQSQREAINAALLAGATMRRPID